MCILFCPDSLLAADLVAVPSCCEFWAIIMPQREWKALNTCKGMEDSGYYGYTWFGWALASLRLMVRVQVKKKTSIFFSCWALYCKCIKLSTN
jgi:hypothetical protein